MTSFAQLVHEQQQSSESLLIDKYHDAVIDTYRTIVRDKMLEFPQWLLSGLSDTNILPSTAHTDALSGGGS